MHSTDVIIIGAGPVGLFAIFQAGMLGMKTHVIDSLNEIGGQCNALYPEKPIYDIPAHPKLLASELIEKLMEQSTPFKPVFHLEQQVMSFEKKGDFFRIKTNKNTEIEAKIIVIAAGAGAFGPNRPPLENIEKYEEKSVFYYVKNPQNFVGKNIAIAGGGDSAIDWAIQLSDIAKKIYLIHRRDKFRASAASMHKVEELIKLDKIELVTPYQLKSLEGSDGLLKSIKLYDLSRNIISLYVDVLLPFFGLSMELGPLAEWGLSLRTNHIEVNKSSSETNIKGIYAIGDIATYEGKLKLILTGFAEAATCFHHAYQKVFDGKILHFEYSTSKKIENL